MNTIELIDLLIIKLHSQFGTNKREFAYDCKTNDDNDDHPHYRHSPYGSHCVAALNISTDIINIDDIVCDINNGEHCIFWYFGAKRLTKECVKFYSSILQHVHSKNAISHLLDLSACKAIQNGDVECLNDINRFTSNIQQISNGKINPIFTAEIYKELSEISTKSNKLLYDFICNGIVNRKELLYASQHYIKKTNNKSEILFGDVFKPEIFAVLSKLKNLKLCECYSILQYLEMLFIINHIIDNEIKRNMTSMTLKFILPNDEYKYYVNAKNINKSIQKFEYDVNRFLNIKYKNIKMSININIHCFKYGNKVIDRPYIKGRGFKKTKQFLSAKQLFLSI